VKRRPANISTAEPIHSGTGSIQGSRDKSGEFLEEAKPPQWGDEVMRSKPKLLDLFCGAGGCTKGYQRAGFYVRGVDHKIQPRYCGEEFIQTDALEYLSRLIESGEVEEFQAIHASPPCQGYSITKNIHTGYEYPQLYEECKALLIVSNLPWVIENTPGVPMPFAVILCGSSFGLNVYRHRCFETDPLVLGVPCRGHLRPCTQVGRKPKSGEVMTIAGHWSGIREGREAMGIDWMTRDELSQAIPPAYTEFIGRQLLTAIQSREGK
jgi:DNA (cytosine-5)-methyltransferase 1